MKTLKILIVVLIGTLSLYSCKKDSSDPVPAKPLLQKIVDNSDESYVTLEYDGSRLKKMLADDNSYMTLEYTATTITENDYSAQNVLEYTTLYSLNTKGLVVSSVSSGSGKKNGTVRKNLLSGLIPLKAINSSLNTFEYNADGYMTKIVLEAGTADQETMEFTISNGNRVGTVYTFGGETMNLISQYLTDKTNTTGSENMGIAFMGKQDKNLMQSITTTYSGFTLIQSYSYQYDAKDRVVKSTTTTNGLDPNSSSYTYK
jgi:hypothetical protein